MIAGARELERLVVRVMADATQYDQVLSAAEKRVVSVANKIESVGRDLALKVTAPLTAMGAVSLNEFSKFDDAMVKSTAVMSGVTDKMRADMEKVAKSISSKSITAPEQVAKSYYFLASAGFDAAQAMAALPAVEKFAVAGAFDMERATSLLADSQSALGLKSADAAENLKQMLRVSDVLVTANNLSNASTEEFAKALTTKSAAALRMLNKDVEEGVAVLAAFADQGTKGEMAGEKLAIVLRDLQTASLNNVAAWSKHGLAIFDAKGKMLPLVDIIEQMEKVIGPMTDKVKKATLAELGFNDRSIDATQTLMGTSQKIRDYEKALRSAGGTTEEVADKQLKSFAAQMAIFKNNITLIAIEVGEILAPSVLQMNSILSSGMEHWHELDIEQKKMIVNVGKIAAITGPAMIVFAKGSKIAASLAKELGVGLGGLVSIIRVVTTGLRVMSLAAILPLLPLLKIVAIVGLIGGAIAGATYLIIGPEGMQNAWRKVVDAGRFFFERTMGFIHNFQENMQILFEWIPQNWSKIWDASLTFINTFVRNMASNFWVGLKTLMRLWVAFQGWQSMIVAKGFEKLMQIDFVGAIGKGLSFGFDLFKSFTKTVLNLMLEFSKALLDILIAIPPAVVTVAVSAAGILTKAIKMILRGEIPDPAELLAEFGVEMVKEFEKLAVKAGEKFGAAAVVIEDALGPIIDQATEDFNKGAENINFIDTAKDIINEGLAEMKGPLEGMGPIELEAPKFKFDRPPSVEGMGGGTNLDEFGVLPIQIDQKPITMDILPPDPKEIDGVKKTLEPLKKPVTIQFTVAGVEGVEAGTMDALLMLTEYHQKAVELVKTPEPEPMKELSKAEKKAIEKGNETGEGMMSLPTDFDKQGGGITDLLDRTVGDIERYQDMNIVAPLSAMDEPAMDENVPPEMNYTILPPETSDIESSISMTPEIQTIPASPPIEVGSSGDREGLLNSGFSPGFIYDTGRPMTTMQGEQSETLQKETSEDRDAELALLERIANALENQRQETTIKLTPISSVGGI